MYNYPELLLTNIAPLEIKKNQREIRDLIKLCIEEAVRKSLPIKSILVEYLSNNDNENEPLNVPANIHAVPTIAHASNIVNDGTGNTSNIINQDNNGVKNVAQNDIVERISRLMADNEQVIAHDSSIDNLERVNTYGPENIIRQPDELMVVTPDNTIRSNPPVSDNESGIGEQYSNTRQTRDDNHLIGTGGGANMGNEQNDPDEEHEGDIDINQFSEMIAQILGSEQMNTDTYNALK